MTGTTTDKWSVLSLFRWEVLGLAIFFPCGGFLKWRYPQIIQCSRVFRKPSILGYLQEIFMCPLLYLGILFGDDLEWSCSLGLTLGGNEPGSGGCDPPPLHEGSSTPLSQGCAEKKEVDTSTVNSCLVLKQRFQSLRPIDSSYRFIPVVLDLLTRQVAVNLSS